MIVDSHAHAFPPMGGPAGHTSTAEHLRYMQQGLLFHHQPTRRMDDNSVYTGANQLYDGEDLSFNGLTDVDFRGDAFGKFAWTADGLDYSKQYLPSTLMRLDAPPELMVAQMDYVGVDKAVFHSGHGYGRLNRYLSDAVKKFPDRFWGLAMVDEWRADQPGQTAVLDRAIDEMGLHALWFCHNNLRLHGRSEPIDDPKFWPFWDHVRDMGIPVFWFVSSSVPGRESYLEEHAAFGRWAQRYPEIPCVYTHGIPLSRFMEGDSVSIPEEAWEPFRSSNVLVEILIPIFQGTIWEYPFAEAQPIVREYYERLGPDRLVWGSDMPNVERNCTYKQCLDYLRLHCDFIPQADMDKICGDNIVRLFEGR